jgi:2-amino-4-hydroxy-6-hydroxymethyldihydropteridine diphosphokinase
MSPSELHPLLAAAAKGKLPPWAVAGRKRRAHMDRVAALMKAWAKSRGESRADVARWAALGHLHDVLRDAKPADLRSMLGGDLLDLPNAVLHGPAAAARLREEGVTDEPLLTAVAFHTLGSPDFDDMGRALYAADFLEPGRKFRPGWRQAMRQRMPQDLEIVVRSILRRRIGRLLERERPVRPETMEFWNAMAKGRAWASASEV